MLFCYRVLLFPYMIPTGCPCLNRRMGYDGICTTDLPLRLRNSVDPDTANHCLMIRQRFLANTELFSYENAQDLPDVFLRGTLPPSLRASDKPIAIACLRLVTFFPDPDRRVPSFSSCMLSSTLSEAFLPYFVAISGLFLLSKNKPVPIHFVCRYCHLHLYHSYEPAIAARNDSISCIDFILLAISMKFLPTCFNRALLVRVWI